MNLIEKNYGSRAKAVNLETTELKDNMTIDIAKQKDME